MRQLYRQGVVCQLMDAAELADDDLVAVVSNMGAPLVGQERLTDPKTMALAVTMMEEYLGRTFRAVMSLEIGGGNAIQPFMAAAMLDRPVVDGDCMGRAFPEAQMTSFAIHDLKDVPAHPRRRPRQRGGGRRGRRAGSGWSASAARPAWRSAPSRRPARRPGPAARSRTARSSARPPRPSGSAGPSRPRGGLTAIRSRRCWRWRTGSRSSRGKIHDIARRTTEGFLRGTATIEGLDEFRGHTFSLAFQNEFAVGWLDGQPRVMTPDLICVLDTVSGDAIGTETLRYGQRVTVIALPAPADPPHPQGHRARRPAGLRLRPRLPLGVRVRRRIGIDVGGTNTDAVLLEDDAVAAAVKTPTTPDVTTGITRALAELVERAPAARDAHAAMIGTTHFTNAVVQRRDLGRVAAVRIGLPSGASLPPFVDWPEDLADLVRGEVVMLEGGHEFDGRPLVPFDEQGHARGGPADPRRRASARSPSPRSSRR